MYSKTNGARLRSIGKLFVVLSPIFINGVYAFRRSGEFCDTHIVSVCNVSKNGRMELASG